MTVSSRTPWTLRRTLVVWVLVLITGVLTAVGGLTVVTLQRSLTANLDQDLESTANVILGGVPGDNSDLHSPRAGEGESPRGGQLGPPGGGTSFLAIKFDDTGAVITASDEFSSPQNIATDLTQAQTQLLLEVPSSNRAQTVDLGDGIGEYRVLARFEAGQTSVIGLSSSGVQAITRQLIWTLGVVALASLIAAAFGVAFLVRRSLAPLGRVAGTASEVSRQDLHLGEVALALRVGDRDTNPATEVGQVGLALNNLLDTMESALQFRHESEQRVRQFVADASHELRTPLASIRGYAELSRRSNAQVPPEIVHGLGRVESESLRMQGLVEDLLLLARLDAGRPLERDTVDLSLLTIDTVSDARVAGGDHRWVLNLPDEPVEVIGDAARLQQVLVNLLANAKVHTPEGTTITTTLRAGSATNSAAFSVADDGPGIPDNVRERIFERFARGDDSRSRKAGSTGLGLSIVDAVVGAHGGAVEVGSSDQGATFTVTLPKR